MACVHHITFVAESNWESQKVDWWSRDYLPKLGELYHVDVSGLYVHIQSHNVHGIEILYISVFHDSESRVICLNEYMYYFCYNSKHNNTGKHIIACHRKIELS